MDSPVGIKPIMKEILKDGHVLPVDARGHLVNECSASKIAEAWRPAIEDLRQAHIDNLGSNLHSLYLRGSIPAGRARTGVSDLDSFAVVHEASSEEASRWIKDYAADFRSRFPFCPYVEIRLLPLQPFLQSQAYQSWRFTLKVLSLCIHGEDLSPQLPKFRPTRSNGFFFFGNIFDVLTEASSRLHQATTPEQTQKICVWAMKKILRTGFSLIMEREQVFTRDLYPSYELFSKHYPNREPEMRQALEWAVNPSSDQALISKYLGDFGGWLGNEARKSH